MSKTAVIVGGGLSGLSAAVKLVDAGWSVTILEKKKFLGGRASNIVDKKMGDPVPIGPHILLSPYHTYRNFLKKIGAHDAIVWGDKFIEIVYEKDKHLVVGNTNLPAFIYIAWWAMSLPFATFREKLSNLRLGRHVFFSSDKQMERLDNISALDFLRSSGIPDGFIDRFWRFFALSMINVPLEECSASTLLILLKHWAFFNRVRVGFAHGGLGDIFAVPATEYLAKRGAKIAFNTSLIDIDIEGDEIKNVIVEKNGKTEQLIADAYIFALNPVDLYSVLPKEIKLRDPFRGLEIFEGVPYITTNIWFDKKITKKQFWAILNDREPRTNMNTDFYDKSNIFDIDHGGSFITSNIIFSHAYHHMSDKEIITKTLEELKQTLPDMDGKVVHSHVHRLPYAIYASRPGVRKYIPSHVTPIKNMYLAGDWLVKDFPQSMEAAVISGERCVRSIIDGD